MCLKQITESVFWVKITLFSKAQRESVGIKYCLMALTH